MEFIDISLSKNDIERFKDNIIVTPNEICWHWKGAYFPKGGYGKFYTKDKNGKWSACRAHRVSWIIYRGHIPNNKLVLHKCDNPKCVNPDHLYLGDHHDNIQDTKNRLGWKPWSTGKSFTRSCPSKNGLNRSITSNDMIEILKLYSTGKYSQRQIASIFKTSQRQVWRVIHNQLKGR